jgi:hypothetical protein
LERPLDEAEQHEQDDDGERNSEKPKQNRHGLPHIDRLL